ncbi:diphthine--ammonia ligase [Craterilacuibacter sp.]|uniref:Dph6-related ATP pyrophosphatase n=1 Tax=Craterilacuibacter sp. TaxID=2870909 RepID=UPI003F3343B4
MSTPLFALSWSGGKDSCLALWRTLKTGAHPLALLSMLDETGERSRSHGITPEVLAAQVAALGIPLVTGNASWGEYEAVFIERLQSLREQGASQAVFGDIDLQAHKDWEEKVCAAAGLQAVLPLWQEQRLDLVREFIDAGFTATIVVIRSDLMAADYLGRVLDHALIARMQAEGIDPCGEGGEFHTLVTDGPLFSHALRLRVKMRHQHDKYSMLEFELSDSI